MPQNDLRHNPFASILATVRLLAEPHTVECMARQRGCCAKSIRREIAYLREIGFDVREKTMGPDQHFAKKYWVVGAKKTMAGLLERVKK